MTAKPDGCSNYFPRFFMRGRKKETRTVLRPVRTRKRFFSATPRRTPMDSDRREQCKLTFHLSANCLASIQPGGITSGVRHDTSRIRCRNWFAVTMGVSTLPRCWAARAATKQRCRRCIPPRQSLATMTVWICGSWRTPSLFGE